MAFKFFNIGKANAEIESAEAAINPALAKANILSITVDGKPVPAAEAPLAARISALLAVNPPGEGQQNVNELMVTNASLATQLERLTGEHAAAIATVAGLQLEKQALETRSTSAEAAVTNLTAQKQSLNVQLEASNSEFSRVNKELAAFNTELSKMCLLAGCLTLTSKDGKPLPAGASESDKLAAAEAVPVAEKLNTYKGAVHGAIARVGLNNTGTIPSGSPAGAQNLSLGSRAVIDRHNAITDPVAKARDYKANKVAIDAAYRELQRS